MYSQQRPLHAISTCLLLLSLFGLLACTDRYIEGTKIEDTDDAREVIRTVETYRKAMENRDADMLIALASKSYFEKNGDANSANNYDYAGLVRFLRSSEFRTVTALRMKIIYRSLEFNEQRNSVTVHYHYTSDFKLPPTKYDLPEGADDQMEQTGESDNFDEEVWHSKSDDNEMILELGSDNKWYILKGM